MAGRLWLFFGFFSTFIYAQIGGQSVYQFLNLIQDHQAHHVGQIIVYLRLNTIEPPKYIGW